MYLVALKATFSANTKCQKQYDHKEDDDQSQTSVCRFRCRLIRKRIVLLIGFMYSPEVTVAFAGFIIIGIVMAGLSWIPDLRISRFVPIVIIMGHATGGISKACTGFIVAGIKMGHLPAGDTLYTDTDLITVFIEMRDLISG